MSDENLHEDCENYVKSKDYCLKFFEENVSENYPDCKEKSVYNDNDLQRKWSNQQLGIKIHPTFFYFLMNILPRDIKTPNVQQIIRIF